MRFGTPAAWLGHLSFMLCAHAAGVTVMFDPANPLTGPFPSDALTVADSAQKTGRRVNLPKPDCAMDAVGCLVLPGLNQLDGFNLQPRIRVRFSAAIDPATLLQGISYVALDNLASDEPGIHKIGDKIRINEIVYDPPTFAAFAKPDSTLDQHRRYALIVTTALKDTAGDPVAPAASFLACQNSAAPGCPSPADLDRIAAAGIAQSTIAAATVFTTESATAWLERARDGLSATTPSVSAGPVIDLGVYRLAVWHQQTGTNTFADVQLPFSSLPGISLMAFGSYSSPSYLTVGQTINRPATAAELPQAQRNETIYFNVFLPAAAKPAGGYPVAIVGHGLSNDRFFTPGAIASSFAGAGWAVIAINAVGHGYGPKSSVIFSGANGQIEVPAPGRGVSQSAGGAITAGDGCTILVPLPVGQRDCILQTSLDLMQLTRAVRSGLDLDGDGSADLDANRVVYAGHSLGAQYGTVFTAVEPSIATAALLSAGGSTTTITRMSEASIPLISLYLAFVAPSLLNAGSTFDANWTLRNEPVRVNTVKGAIDLQEAFEKVEWLNAAGDGINFAAHLKSSPLAGVPAKKVLWQFPIGDRTSPNPTESAMILASGMQESTRVYRADLAYAANPAIPLNPHSFMLDISTAANLPVAIAAQSQIVGFLASGGAVIPDPNSQLTPASGVPNLFERPATLPESLNYLSSLVPALLTLSPSSAVAGGPGFTLTLRGSNFGFGSTVLWNGQSRPISAVTRTELAASIPANDIAAAGAAVVTVFNPSPGGGTSNALTFTVMNGIALPAPAVSSGGIVNAAGFGMFSAAPGSIASVFGSNFTAETSIATTLSLPTTLGGVSVQINGLSVPLLSVSPQQINFQVPWYLQDQTQAVLAITVNGVHGSPAAFSLAKFSPALFTVTEDGRGQGVVLIRDSGEIAAPAGAFATSRPARRGEIVSVYSTGLGPVTNQPATGSPGQATPAAGTLTLPAVTIGAMEAKVLSSALDPALVGVYRVNVEIPANAPLGDAIHVLLSAGGSSSNTVTIAIQ